MAFKFIEVTVATTCLPSAGVRGEGAAPIGLLWGCGPVTEEGGVAFPAGALPVCNVRTREEAGLCLTFDL